jgi:pilus assembly protein CpaB
VKFLKNKWIYILAIFFGLLTTYFIYEFLITVEKKVTHDLTEEVVVLVHDITPKTLLTRDMLTKKHLPAEYIHPDAIRTLDDALGCISLTPFVEGEQLLKSKIVAKGDVKNGLAYLIPVGERAMTIAVDDVSGVAGLLKPGDRVDVASVMGLPDSSDVETMSSLIVLQDIVVLAVGKNISENSSKNTENSSKTVTLAVTVEEAQRLLLANQKGIIRLLLRSPVDNSIVKTNPFEAQDFVQ